MAPPLVNVLVGVVAVALCADGLNRLRHGVRRGDVEASPLTLSFAGSLLALAAVGSLYAVRGIQGATVPTRVRTALFVLVAVVAVGNYAVGRS